MCIVYRECVVVKTSFWVGNCSSGSSQVVYWLITLLVLANPWHLRNLPLSSQDPLCLWLWSKHTSISTHATLVPHYIKHNPNQRHYCCCSLRQPPQGLVLILFSTGLNCLVQPLSDSYRLWRCSLAALHAREPRWMHQQPLFIDERNKTLYAWQSVLKWIPLLPAGISEVHS